jgi:hypothetical protein
MAFMPQFAPFVALTFLGAILTGMVAATVFLYGMVRRQPRVRLCAGIALVAVPLGYATLLFGASLTSHEHVLPHGGKKYFCEIDCHLAYSVERVTRGKTLGIPPNEARASGEFYRVSLKTWFDESTTSVQRPKEAPLYPNPRQVYIEDSSGRRFPPSEAGQRALEASGVKSTPLSRQLIPGESYITELCFDLPTDIREPKLYVGDSDPMSALLIGHEESPLHRKIWFRI